MTMTILFLILALAVLVLGAAPTPTVRQTPAGIMLENGHRTTFTFAYDPDVSLWEVEVTPFGVDGGDHIDITTQHNSVARTKAPRSLYEMTDGEFTAGFDPVILTQIMALVNRRTTITVTFPDGSTWCDFGYLKMFKPNGQVEGTMPLANCTIVITSYDPAAHVEAAPVVASVSGT